MTMGIRRASTFPESMTPKKQSILPLSQPHIPHSGIDAYNSSPQSHTDYFEVAPGLSPTSNPLGNYGLPSVTRPQHHPGQSLLTTPLTTFADATGLSVDINTMMFPSADPLAYPNQPMTTFEERHPQNYQYKHGSPTMTHLPYHVTGAERKSSMSPFSVSGVANVPMSQRRPDNEVQLLGPMPMYLMQGAQQPNLSAQQSAQNAQAHIQSHPPPNMNFDELFGREEWAQAFMDPGLGLSGNPGYNGPPPYGPAGSAMGNWH